MAQVGAAISAVAGAIFGSETVGIVGRLLASVALSALGRAMADEPQPMGLSVQQTVAGGDEPAEFILGEYATGGVATHEARSHDIAGKTPNEMLNYVIEFSDIPGCWISAVFLDGARVPVLEETHVLYGRKLGGDYEDVGWIKIYTGDQVAADPMMLAKYGSAPIRPWDSGMIGQDICYAILTFKLDPEVYSGFPQVRFEVQGIPHYDPRKDSTAGGSGSHRWADVSTWERSQNPVVMIYNIMRGIRLPGGEVWGGGYAASEMPTDVWFAAMNVCDEVLTGGIPRYRAGFRVLVDMEPASVIEELKLACNGQMVDTGAGWIIRVGGPGLPVMFITDDDLVSTEVVGFDPFPGLQESANAITGRCPDPNALWEVRDLPPRYNATWEAEDGGRRLPVNVDFNAVPYVGQCQRLMAALIKDHRRKYKHSLPLGRLGCLLEPLDVISWTSGANDYTAKKFEVTQVAEDPILCVARVAVREVDASDHDFSDGEYLDAPTVTEGRTRPGVQVMTTAAATSWQAMDNNGIPRRPAIRLTYDPEEISDAYALAIRYRAAGETEWTTTDDNTFDGSRIITAVSPNTTYQWQVKPKVFGRRVDWTSVQTVTSPRLYISHLDMEDQDAGNLIPNGSVATGDFQGWTLSTVPAAFVVLARDQASTNPARATCPTKYMVRIAPVTAGAPVSDRSAQLGEFPVAAGARYAVSYALAGTAGASGTLSLFATWIDDSGAVISTSTLQRTVTTGTWATHDAEFVAPANAASVRMVLRTEAGAGNFVYVTEVRTWRKHAASRSIEDGTVATAQIANGAVTTAKLPTSAVTTVKIAPNAVTVGNVAGTGEVEQNHPEWTIVSEFDITITEVPAVGVGTFQFRLNTGVANYPNDFQISLFINGAQPILVAMGLLEEDPDRRHYCFSINRAFGTTGVYTFQMRMRNAGGHGVLNSSMGVIVAMR